MNYYKVYLDGGHIIEHEAESYKKEISDVFGETLSFEPPWRETIIFSKIVALKTTLEDDRKPARPFTMKGI